MTNWIKYLICYYRSKHCYILTITEDWWQKNTGHYIRSHYRCNYCGHEKDHNIILNESIITRDDIHKIVKLLINKE